LDARGLSGPRLSAFVEGLILGAYRYTLATDVAAQPEIVDLCGASDDAAIERGRRMAAATAWARDVANARSNEKTPAWLAAAAVRVLSPLGVSVTERDVRWLRSQGFGGVLAVGGGSAAEPRLIEASWQPRGARRDLHIVLVGKGITFDSGGISIKPAADMDQMKFDMCGAASVLGVFRTIAELKAKLNVVGLIPACENLPSGRATKPGDIVKSMSGQTVEILNTDAEGRLILADALTYAERYEPEAVVDVATLTGAMVVALGHVACGVFSNNDALARALVAAGDDAYDRAWQLPLWDDYQEGLNSNFADFANVAGRAGGSITAACFLSRFAKKYDWAHLDIAGIAWKEGKEKGATGRPVPLLATWLLAQEGSAPQ
jgi:leucyl aminopeptidase